MQVKVQPAMTDDSTTTMKILNKILIIFRFMSSPRAEWDFGFGWLSQAEAERISLNLALANVYNLQECKRAKIWYRFIRV